MAQPALARPAADARQNGFLPDFCRLPLVLGVLLTAELLAIVLALASPRPLSGFWGRLGPLSLYIQVIALAGSALLCLLRPRLALLADRLAGLAAWGILVVLTALLTWALVLLPSPVSADLLPADGLAGLMARALGIGGLVAALLLRYLYLHQLWRRQEQAQSAARLQALQARIRPHFLFNSINTIASLIPSAPQLAEELLQDLADLFRAALAEPGVRSTLSQEIELARRYLSIERQRLGERLQVSWDLEELPGEAPLPALTLQPLLENAVYHGIAPASAPGQIQISGRFRRGRVNLSVRNTLPAGGERRASSAGLGMALDNVRERMAALYPAAAQVIESRIEGDYQVRLVFPYPWRER